MYYEAELYVKIIYFVWQKIASFDSKQTNIYAVYYEGD